METQYQSSGWHVGNVFSVMEKINPQPMVLVVVVLLIQVMWGRDGEPLTTKLFRRVNSILPKTEIEQCF